jgi:hypothetical protein
MTKKAVVRASPAFSIRGFLRNGEKNNDPFSTQLSTLYHVPSQERWLEGGGLRAYFCTHVVGPPMASRRSAPFVAPTTAVTNKRSKKASIVAKSSVNNLP